MLWRRQLSNMPRVGLQTSCLLHMHNSSHSTHFVSALTLLCRGGIILSSDQQQQKSCVLQKTVWSHMLGKMVPFCAWATFVPETFVVFSEPQYLLLCVVDDSLVLSTLVCNHPSHATTLTMQPPSPCSCPNHATTLTMQPPSPCSCPNHATTLSLQPPSPCSCPNHTNYATTLFMQPPCSCNHPNHP